MNPWFRFVALLLVQLFLFVILGLRWRVRRGEAFRILLRSMLAGAAIGLLFDVLIGHYENAFGYSRFEPRLLFYLANGIFSYGFAIATTWLLPGRLSVSNSWPITALTAIGSFAALLTLFTLPQDTRPLTFMFCGGAAIVIMSEAAAALRGFRGAIVQALCGDPMLLVQLWMASLGIGAVYETANWIFPVWHWQGLVDFTFFQREALIISVGYFVLVYPMFVATRIFLKPLNHK